MNAIADRASHAETATPIAVVSTARPSNLPRRAFPPTVLSLPEAVAPELVGRFAMALKNDAVRRAAIALGFALERQARLHLADWAIRAAVVGALSEGITEVEWLTRSVRAVDSESEELRAEQNTAQARLRALSGRIDPVRFEASRRHDKAMLTVKVGTERLRSLRQPNERPLFQKIVDLGVPAELVKGMGVVDVRGNVEREQAQLEQEIEQARKEVAALEAYSADGNLDHLAELHGFEHLIADARAVEGRPL